MKAFIAGNGECTVAKYAFTVLKHFSSIVKESFTVVKKIFTNAYDQNQIS